MPPRSNFNERDAPTLVKQMSTLEDGLRAASLVRLHFVIERVAGKVTSETVDFEGDVCRIGSHPSNDVVLDDPTISRFHCRIAREGEAWRITDTGSKNGTRFDGVKILAAELDAEAVLSLGDSIVRVKPVKRGHISRIPASPAFGSLVGQSDTMQRLFALLERVAASEIDVLVHGESGTGKELVASEIVARSARAEGPVVVVDCGSISPSLVESELFGHVRGAFTGADREREGAFEAADGGTLFLDEIGELPLELQPKLLRVLEAREVRRVGQTRMRRIDVRVIAATNRDLEREVNRGRFREDLYYRLAKVALRVPPLRDRLEDIPLLVKNFVGLIGHADGSNRLLGAEAILGMQQYDWPGNVRELKNYVERSIVLDEVPPPTRRSGTVPVYTGPSATPTSRKSEGEPQENTPFRIAKEQAVAAFERAYLGPLLERCNGNVSQAAREAKMDRMYLHQLAQRYGFPTARKG